MATGLVWQRPPIALVPRLDDYRERLLAALKALADHFAARIEAYAKTNAPWTDRTEAARQGLRAFAAETATGVVLYLVHSVSYGVFLELAHAGRFAIIGPTLETFYGEIARAVRALVRR